MPFIKVWGMPPIVAQDDLMQLFHDLKKAASQTLGISPEDVSVQFPKDILEPHAGELIGEICGLFVQPERTPEILDKLRKAIFKELISFSGTKLTHDIVYVEVYIASMVNPDEVEIWTSTDPATVT